MYTLKLMYKITKLCKKNTEVYTIWRKDLEIFIASKPCKFHKVKMDMAYVILYCHLQ